MKVIHKNYKYSEPTISNPYLDINKHRLLGHHIKSKYPHLPMIQAQHFGKVLSL